MIGKANAATLCFAVVLTLLPLLLDGARPNSNRLGIGAAARSSDKRQHVAKKVRKKRTLKAKASGLLERKSVTGAAKSEAHLISILDWGKQQGIKGIDNLQVKTVSKARNTKMVRGIVVKRRMKKGAEVLVVPSSNLLLSHGKMTEAIFRQAGVPASVNSREAAKSARKQNITISEPKLRMAAGLLALKQDPSSSWAGYIQSLPNLAAYRKYHPSAARGALLRAFQPLPISKLISLQQRKRNGRWKEFKRRGGKATREAWEWAELTVMTRNWIGPGGHGIMMTPVADAINSGLPSQANLEVVLGDPESGRPFIYKAKRDIRAGEELIVNYARIPDEKFMAIWGFMPHLSAPARLDGKSCARLAHVVGVDLIPSAAVGTPKSKGWVLSAEWPDTQPPKCRAPPDELQKDAYCTLAELAAAQCGGKYFEATPSRKHRSFWWDPKFLALLVLVLETLLARWMYRRSLESKNDVRRFSAAATFLSRAELAAGGGRGQVSARAPVLDSLRAPALRAGGFSNVMKGCSGHNRAHNSSGTHFKPASHMGAMMKR